jgi:hypothetical protein
VEALTRRLTHPLLCSPPFPLSGRDSLPCLRAHGSLLRLRTHPTLQRHRVSGHERTCLLETFDLLIYGFDKLFCVHLVRLYLLVGVIRRTVSNMPRFDFLIAINGNSSHWRHSIEAPSLTHATNELLQIAYLKDWRLLTQAESDALLEPV